MSSEPLPYVPTTILPLSNPWACGNKSNHGIYILSPTDTSVDLLFLNTSSTLEAGSLSPQTLTSGVPFLDAGSSSTAFTASVDDNETLTVFAGDCSSSGGQAVWTYGSAITSAGGQSWTKHSASQSGSSSTTSQGPPYFLGASLSFSTTIEPVMSAPVTYVYGGMCPWSNSSVSTWQSSASYTNRMVKVSGSGSGDQTTYSFESSSSYGSPIAEAGFSFTALTPSISDRSGIVTQQISHVLLGGHTNNAFINMSTAAIWNLPEETWNTIFINPPAAGSYGNPDLAIREGDGSVVEPRSGHTAVLNEEGTALVILGGWVGSLTTAAIPQLVVLEMGTSLAEWHWSIPTSAQPSGPGIYGHGAALLPGNVMMVYGGHSTSTQTTKRATTQTPTFLNLTSLTWSDKYTNPTSPNPESTSGTSPSSPINSDSNLPSQLGLGLGLGIGIPLLLLLISLAICLRRRQTLKRRQREEVVRGLSQDASRFLSIDNDDEMIDASRDYGAGWLPPAWNASAARDWYTGGSDPYVLGSRSLGYESLRGGRNTNPGLYPPALPPMAADRSSTRSRGAARGLYLPTTGIGSGGGYEFGSSSGLGHNPTTSGGIHPIYEAEDEDGEITAPVRGDVSPTHDHRSDAGSDPFITPTTTPRGVGPTMYFPPPSRSSATPSPENVSRPRQGQDAEVTEWVSDVDAADALLTARISPHGTTTTTPPRQQQNTGNISPSRLLPSKPNSLAAVNDSGDEARTGSNLSESARSTFSFTRSGSQRMAGAGVQRAGSSSGSSSHTYRTAKTTNANFVTLRDEGPGLLMGKNKTAKAGKGRTTVEDDELAEEYSPPGSPSKSKPIRQRGWLGSLRRVFSGSSPSGSSRGESPTHEGLAGEVGGSGSDYEPRLVGMGPGGRLLRRKQGREAWTAGDIEVGVMEDEDWDVERAVEQRLVQIMFTVPKERLRVVNAEIEREEEAVVVVDPSKEGYEEDDDMFVDRQGHYRREEKTSHYEDERDPEKEVLRQEEDDRRVYGDSEKDVMTREEEALRRQEETGYSDGRDPEKEALRREEKGKDVLRETTLTLPDRRGDGPPRTPITPVSIHTAEAVRLERPKTKVLQMVESLESLSRSGSPSTSPSR